MHKTVPDLLELAGGSQGTPPDAAADQDLIPKLSFALLRPRESTDSLYEVITDIFLCGRDRDELVAQAMILLTRASNVDDLQEAAVRGIKKLLTKLKENVTDGTMGMCGPDDFPVSSVWHASHESKEILKYFIEAGLSLSKGWNIVTANRPPMYPMQYMDVWYWAIRAGAKDVIDQLVKVDLMPGNGPNLRTYLAIAVDHLRKVLSTRSNDLMWKWEDDAFDRAMSAVSHLLSIYTSRYGIASLQQLTHGTGLLHYLVHCQRYELRDSALEFARCLLSGSYHKILRSAPMVDVNECFSVQQAIHPPANHLELAISKLETPLHGAVFMGGWKKMILLLLDYDANPEQKGDWSGLTPYGLAKKLHLDGESLVSVCKIMRDHTRRPNLEQGDTSRAFDRWNGNQASVSWAVGGRLRQTLLASLWRRREVKQCGYNEAEPENVVKKLEDVGKELDKLEARARELANRCRELRGGFKGQEISTERTAGSVADEATHKQETESGQQEDIPRDFLVGLRAIGPKVEEFQANLDGLEGAFTELESMLRH